MSKLYDALNPTKRQRMTVAAQPATPAQRMPAQLPITGTAGWHPLAATPLSKIESPVGILTALLGFYTMLYVAPVVEIMGYYLHVYFPIVVITGALLVVAFPFTGHMGRFLKSPLAKPWIPLLAFYLLAAAFSSYRGGSIPFMVGYCCRIHTFPFLFCAIALTTRRVRHLMLWTVAACLLVMLLCMKYGHSIEGRFALDQTSLENPNDLAFNLLFGGAFLLILAFQRSWVSRLAWAATFPISLGYVLKSGSRANFVTLIAVAVLAWSLASRSMKIALLFLAPVLVIFMVMLVPPGTRERLMYIVSDPRLTLAMTDDPTVQAAVSSQLARTELQKRAWKMTLEHPLLGVGPLQYADNADSMVRQETGRKSGWQVPHNVYLQISSECGIPALIFYIWSIGLCCKMNYRSYKMCGRTPEYKMARAQSYCLILASSVYAVGILFCNVAYFAYLPILVGFTAANAMAVQREIQEKSTDLTKMTLAKV